MRKVQLILMCMLIISCSKEKSCESCIGNPATAKAKIIYSGPLEADGCGWLIQTDSVTYYHADQLDTAFQQNQLAVEIKYDLTTEKYICGLAASKLPVIHILSIKKV